MWKIVLDLEADIRPGLPTTGESKVHLRVVSGNVDLTPLMLRAEGVIKTTMSLFHEIAELKAVLLAQGCSLLDRGGKRCMWLWGQVVLHMSSVLDSAVLELKGTKEDASQGESLVERRRAQSFYPLHRNRPRGAL